MTLLPPADNVERIIWRAYQPERRITFIGEAIHGVGAFTTCKLDFARRYCGKNWVWVFEADHLGMALSHANQEPASARLINFPVVMRTKEMLGLLTWGIDVGIPCLGADPIPRRPLASFPATWLARRTRQMAFFHKIRGSDGYFARRDRCMAHLVRQIAGHYADAPLLVMMHNMHIKRCGSREIPSLRLKSVRECLTSHFPEQMESIALLARQGTACHNDLTSFSFAIDDPYSAEVFLAAADQPSCLVAAADIPSEYVAWHHAFERETRPVREQYEWCVLFAHVNAPVLTQYELSARLMNSY
ncbi:erythromycin esterase family protein [Brenneria goodwinii]|uniref:erythromycin esterase family protein n=1 Tax=Brenneria goodwinii TaxID=1109412 RepID=UPI000EF27E3C|nr:erythromycin esterase family protein [Brenneria goodwinii]MCG8158931.1 erythromycin esterase family protein [Brenneria goodwinii]MCG8163721.1 erythromycin esterase family protein [Brenneria goodwinii]MCG8166520.1 erythromycin esterase family protein [Brenneria goodwinii]MCG8170496.1 erythromycin esterase family protein [Brenneria goodwinii]MCG8177610.1 erythromycin esterase family protein [Brenneria goodwinii]